MRFNPKARLDTSRVGDAGRPRRRRWRRRRRGIPIPGGTKAGGGIGGVIIIVLFIVLTSAWRRRLAGGAAAASTPARMAGRHRPLRAAARPARTPTRAPTAPGWRSRTRSYDYWAEALPEQTGTQFQPDAGRDLHRRRRHRLRQRDLRGRPVLLPDRPDHLPRHHVLRGRAPGAARRPGRRLRRALRARPTSTATTSRTCSAPWARSRPSRARPATRSGSSSRPTATPACGPSGATSTDDADGVQMLRSTSTDDDIQRGASTPPRPSATTGSRSRRGGRVNPEQWTHGSAAAAGAVVPTGYNATGSTRAPATPSRRTDL